MTQETRVMELTGGGGFSLAPRVLLWRARLAAVLAQQASRRMLWVPVFLGGGVALYFALHHEPDLRLLAVLTGIAALVSLRLRFMRLPMVFLLGLTLASWEAHRVAAPKLSWFYTGPVTGEVRGYDRAGDGRLRMWLGDVRLASRSPPHQIRISVPEPAPPIGSRVMLIASLGPPPEPTQPEGFDFRRYAWFKQIGGVGSAKGPVLLTQTDPEPAFAQKIARMRAHLATLIRAEVGGREGAFAAAILVGDRTALDAGALDALRRSNLAHLLAISGLHMGLLTGTVFTLLRLLALWPRAGIHWPVKKIAAIGGIVSGALYLVISGASIPTVRAFVTVTCLYLAILMDRQAISLRSVALAATLILLITPSALTNAGFQMSFAATTALVWVFGTVRITRQRGFAGRMVAATLSLALASFVAGMATAPFGAWHFHMVSRIGLIANLFAVPLMGSLIMPAGLLMLALMPFGISALPALLMKAGIAAVLGVAEGLGGLDISAMMVKGAPGYVLGLITLGGLITVLWRGRGKLVGAVMIASALVLWGALPRDALLIAPGGKLIGWTTPEGRALSSATSQNFAAQLWLEEDGDPATQEEAAGRASRYPLETIGVNSEGQGADCGTSWLLIRRKDEDAPPAPCRILDKTDLAAAGAIAFHHPGGAMRTAGRRSRLWSR
ncbi:ComEC/Rec2 family competence protein [Paracoccaceae bacterium GXU_MW_L88]